MLVSGTTPCCLILCPPRKHELTTHVCYHDNTRFPRKPRDLGTVAPFVLPLRYPFCSDLTASNCLLHRCYFSLEYAVWRIYAIMFIVTVIYLLNTHYGEFMRPFFIINILTVDNYCY